ncbi:uncharacterized protein RAG0_16717 [Rhynchosporium agropyri]|uniref:Uncharacterized protein n=1 Tax=Rhynchosporium agropyri TaxID=914238 RepID=A0A1E1LRN0_9HELO|nr:uncharacterized protein RAG0_16717 [Rhynchosporium agropyri]
MAGMHQEDRKLSCRYVITVAHAKKGMAHLNAGAGPDPDPHLQKMNQATNGI